MMNIFVEVPVQTRWSVMLKLNKEKKIIILVDAGRNLKLSRCWSYFPAKSNCA